MSAPQIHIKLSLPNGSTRVVAFETLPTWDGLAARVQTLFDILADSVALAYVDGDGDEVTLSSQGEFNELLSPLLSNADSTAINMKFSVRDLRVLRQVRTPDHENDANEHEKLSAGVADGNGEGDAQGERAVPLGDGVEHLPFWHAHPVPCVPSRGFSPRGRGGRGGMRGRFARGSSYGHNGVYGPPGFFPPPHGAFALGRGAPPSPVMREMYRARSAPPEFCARAPEDDFPPPPQPEDFDGEHLPPFPPFPPFDGRFSVPCGPPPPPQPPTHGEAPFAHFHFHHPHMRPNHHERGARGGPFARGRGGFGFGHHHGPFGHGPHGAFPDFDEYPHLPFDFGGRAGRGRFPGFGHHDPRMHMGMDMRGFDFDDPRTGMGPGGYMSMSGPRVAACAGI